MDFGKLTSLEELIEAIDMGLDILFVLHDVWYNISTNETPFVAVCPDGDGCIIRMEPPWLRSTPSTAYR